MDYDFNFFDRCMRLDFDSNSVPQINCPISSQPIFPSMTNHGVFWAGEPHSQGPFVDYSNIQSGMFAIYAGRDEGDYFRDDIENLIENSRTELKDQMRDEDETYDEEDFYNDYPDVTDFFQKHVRMINSLCRIFHIVLDGDEKNSIFIGIDYSIPQNKIQK